MQNSLKKLKIIAANSIANVLYQATGLQPARQVLQINDMVYLGGGDRVEIDVGTDGKIAGSGQIIGR